MKKFTMMGCALVWTIPTISMANTVLHQNEVRFIHEQTHDGAAALFLVERHSVTKDQPSEIKDQEYLSHWYTPSEYAETIFWVNAGRHKSQDVLNDLTQWGLDTSTVPNEMNFAVMGTLGFTLSYKNTYICKDIALAQTGIGLNNHWYTFSLNGSGVYHGTRYTDMTCINTVSKLNRAFRIFSIGTNTFVINVEGPEVVGST